MNASPLRPRRHEINPLAPAPGRDHPVARRLRDPRSALITEVVVPSFEKTFAERTAAIEGGIAAGREASRPRPTPSSPSSSKQLAEARHEARGSARRLASRVPRSSPRCASRRRPRRRASPSTARRRSRPSASRRSSRCEPRSAPSPPTWPAASSARPWTTRRARAASVERFLAELESQSARRPSRSVD